MGITQIMGLIAYILFLVIIGWACYNFQVNNRKNSDLKREEEEKREKEKQAQLEEFDTKFISAVNRLISDNDLLFDSYLGALAKHTIEYTYLDFDIERLKLIEYYGNKHNVGLFFSLENKIEVCSNLTNKLIKNYIQVPSYELKMLLDNIPYDVKISTMTEGNFEQYILSRNISNETLEKIKKAFDLYTKDETETFYRYIEKHPEAYQIARQNEIQEKQTKAIEQVGVELRYSQMSLENRLSGIETGIHTAAILGIMSNLY